MSAPYFSISVHDLVDFLLRSGDIDNRVYNSETMSVGTKMHGEFQKKQGRGYLSEVSLKETFSRPDGTIALEGRADGIIIGEYPIIDEIKTTVDSLEHFASVQEAWHEGQALCYALMYAHANDCSKMGIRLTYLSQIDEGQLVREKTYSIGEIEEKVYKLLDDYLAFFVNEVRREEARNASCGNLSFPYESFRPGQKDMASAVYEAIENKEPVFIEAPTGIGKTVSSLYPALKSFAKGRQRKIFYLTAKNSGARSAFSLMEVFNQKGLTARYISLLSKEKMCPYKKGVGCNPDECPLSIGYYSKLRDVYQEILPSGQSFSPEYVQELAEERAMCPFELQLDLSSYCDVIIGDYNYFFDPLVRLERFFETEEVGVKPYTLLVDEAHNLPERGRDMLSETLSLSDFLSAKKALKTLSRPLTNTINKFIGQYKAFSLQLGEDQYADWPEFPEGFKELGEKLRTKERERSKKKGASPLPEAYKNLSRKVYRFFYLLDAFDRGSMIYLERSGEDIILHLYCLDPSPYLESKFAEVEGKAIFSATMSPMDFYMKITMGSDEYKHLSLPSPFPRGNLSLTIAKNVSIRYKDRERTYGLAAEYLKRFVSQRKGNYFIYFPSYEYLKKIRPLLDFGDAEILEQNSEMSPREKERFLSRFEEVDRGNSLIGLLVIGGVFAEGVDLPSDKLIGVAVVGTGLASLSREKDLIRDRFGEMGEDGFAFAYRNPGFNKVTQAVGRLIRSEFDVGAVLLLDDRYMKRDYYPLIKGKYKHFAVCSSPEELSDILSSFYSRFKF